MNKKDIKEITGIVVDIFEKKKQKEKLGFELEIQPAFQNGGFSPVVWDDLYQLLSEQENPITNQTIAAMLTADVFDVTGMTRLMYKAGWLRLYKVKDSNGMKNFYDVVDNLG